MSDRPIFPLKAINMNAILSSKSRLNQEEILEPVLSSNIDFAAREIMYMKPALLSGASLFVSGESELVQFLWSSDGFMDLARRNLSRIRFTVISNDGQPQLIRHVTCSAVIKDSDIKDAHFLGHVCQDEVISCRQQARDKVTEHSNLEILNIICNSLSLTYAFNYLAAEANQSPQSSQQSAVTSYTIKTRCRFVSEGYIDIEKLLEVRCRLEQEKPQKKGLTACIDHLLKKMIESNSSRIRSGVILQSDGEMVEIHVPRRDYAYFISDWPTGVCMIAENLPN